MTTQLNWFPFVRPQPTARLRLVCFHYAGGRSLMYRGWQTAVPETIQIVPVELPGRGGRIREPLYRRLEPLIDALIEAIQPLLTEPVVFFGHSMGGLISFELTRALRRRGLRLPRHLLISGYRAPHMPNPSAPTHNLPDDQLIAKVRAMNGIPAEVLAHPELLELITPILRADFEVCDTYAYAHEPALDVPITVFGGEHDPVVPPDLLAPWQQHTTANYAYRQFQGDHFFIHQHEAAIVQQIATILQS